MSNGKTTIPFASWTFPFEAGALIRKAMLFQLRSLALKLGLNFESIDDGGWISTQYQIRVNGPTVDVDLYKRSVLAWVKTIEPE